MHPAKHLLAPASSQVQHHYRSTAYDTHPTTEDESSRFILPSTSTPSHDPAHSSAAASALMQDAAEADLHNMIRRQME